MSKWLMSSNVSRVWRNMPHGHQLPDGPRYVNFVGNFDSLILYNVIGAFVGFAVEL
jgi:hypothetical protein